MIICNLVLFEDSTSLRRVLKWVKMGNHCPNGPFWHFVVCCKAYVHPQYNVTHPMSQLEQNVITCKLVRIGDASTLITSA